MKYNHESLDYAIDYILPAIKNAKEAGIHFNRPELVKMVAWEAFVTDAIGGQMRYEKSLCYRIVWEAACDIEELGRFNFGDKDIKEQI